MEINSETVNAVIVKLLRDPTTSFWVRAILKEGLQRDPVEAARDARLVYRVLSARSTLVKGEK